MKKYMAALLMLLLLVSPVFGINSSFEKVKQEAEQGIQDPNTKIFKVCRDTKQGNMCKFSHPSIGQIAVGETSGDMFGCLVYIPEGLKMPDGKVVYYVFELFLMGGLVEQKFPTEAEAEELLKRFNELYEKARSREISI